MTISADGGVRATATNPRACPFMHDGFDFTSPDLLVKGIPIPEFALLRKTAPVWWNAYTAGPSLWGDEGYWVISRHEDIKAISKDHHTWSTNKQGVIMRFPDEMTPDQLELTKALLINHDPPEHTRLRKLISRLFTPRGVAALHEKLDLAARKIVQTAAAKGEGNFVDDVAAGLPLLAIADLLGVPEEDRENLFHWSNMMMNGDDPEFEGAAVEANAQIIAYAYNMAEQRRKNPTDDIVSMLVQADIDGEALDETEFGFFVILLAVAGNETTRNAIAHGMNAFFDNPAQWEIYKRDRPKTAPDEIVRWATPVQCFQRTALADTTVGGIDIAAGQRVGMFYSSANYDDDIFDRPFEFDITRDPNPHLGFGGSGAHYCIGANLARMEIDLMFNAIADIVPDITKTAEPLRLRSGWINGLKTLPVRYTA